MQEKSYINCLLHWNLEFIAGETNTYDKLLNEAFEPALDIFLQCPEWHADFEVSGLMLEFTDQRFPWIIAKLRTLNRRGQVDVICVHYSETIWPAFPLIDFRHSWAIDKAIIDRLGLRFSPTFFAQENFFGEGVADVAKEFGIQHAVIPEKNYAWPFQALTPLYPVYDMQGLDLVIRGEEKQDGRWWIFEDTAKNLKVRFMYDKAGDGEPWVGEDPYSPGGLWRNEDKIKQKLVFYKENLAAGVHFTTTHEFVEEMAKLGIQKPKLLGVPDGPWGLKSPGVFQWMGLYFSYYELDVEMRSLTFRARAMILAAEALVDLVGAQGTDVSRYRILLNRGWRKLINSEVSDSSGWVPTLIERYYAIDNALAAFFWGEKICRELRPLLGLTNEAIDTLDRRPVPWESTEITGDTVDLLEEWGMQVVGPKVKSTCIKINPNHYHVKFSFLHGDVNTGVRFAFRDPKNLSYSPALMDGKVVAHPLKNYNPECTHLFLPLPNGLINLSPEWWVIKHNDCSHVACKVNFTDHTLDFMTMMNMMALGGREQLGIELFQNWQFTLIKGTAEEALRWAKRINLYPIVPAKYPVWPTKPEPWIPFTRMVTK